MAKPHSNTAFYFHNHNDCITDAVDKAGAICKQRGLKLTDTRRRVLELVWQSHEPMGAYEILAQFNNEGRNSAPPTVYRALDFLQENGFVHRIASLNAFVGCICPEHGHQGSFLICKVCNQTKEITDRSLQKEINSVAEKEGFKVESLTLEISGTCPNCMQS